MIYISFNRKPSFHYWPLQPWKVGHDPICIFSKSSTVCIWLPRWNPITYNRFPCVNVTDSGMCWHFDTQVIQNTCYMWPSTWFLSQCPATDGSPSASVNHIQTSCLWRILYTCTGHCLAIETDWIPKCVYNGMPTLKLVSHIIPKNKSVAVVSTAWCHLHDVISKSGYRQVQLSLDTYLIFRSLPFYLSATPHWN